MGQTRRQPARIVWIGFTLPMTGAAPQREKKPTGQDIEVFAAAHPRRGAAAPARSQGPATSAAAARASRERALRRRNDAMHGRSTRGQESAASTTVMGTAKSRLR